MFQIREKSTKYWFSKMVSWGEKSLCWGGERKLARSGHWADVGRSTTGCGVGGSWCGQAADSSQCWASRGVWTSKTQQAPGFCMWGGYFSSDDDNLTTLGNVQGCVIGRIALWSLVEKGELQKSLKSPLSEWGTEPGSWSLVHLRWRVRVL